MITGYYQSLLKKVSYLAELVHTFPNSLYYDLDISMQGILYAADATNGKLVRLALPAKTVLPDLPVTANPLGVTVAGAELLVTYNLASSPVRVFSSEGGALRTFGAMSYAHNVVVLGDAYYAGDYLGQKIRVYSAAGVFLKDIPVGARLRGLGVHKGALYASLETGVVVKVNTTTHALTVATDFGTVLYGWPAWNAWGDMVIGNMQNPAGQTLLVYQEDTSKRLFSSVTGEQMHGSASYEGVFYILSRSGKLYKVVRG